jgi:hypothetical protein
LKKIVHVNESVVVLQKLSDEIKDFFNPNFKSLFLPHDEIKDRSAFMSCAIVSMSS